MPKNEIKIITRNVVAAATLSFNIFSLVNSANNNKKPLTIIPIIISISDKKLKEVKSLANNSPQPQ